MSDSSLLVFSGQVKTGDAGLEAARPMLPVPASPLPAICSACAQFILTFVHSSSAVLKARTFSLARGPKMVE